MENGLFKVTRVLKNDGFTPRIIKLIFEAVTVFTPTRYLIPCVSYNGNYWGEGKEPKGMLCEETGEPWIHSYDRTPVPSCSITETKEIAFSLFASNETTESLVSSVSLRPAGEGRISQRIYWPVTEAPFTYYENDKYNAPLHTYITLGAGETFTVSVYMLCSVPKWENYGACATLDRALEVQTARPTSFGDSALRTAVFCSASIRASCCSPVVFTQRPRDRILYPITRWAGADRIS